LTLRRPPKTLSSPLTRLLPIDEKKSARSVELRFALGRRDLELQLVYRVLGTVPTVQREIPLAPRVRQKHGVDHRVPFRYR
jgi:hypothetical protein